ncbi:MAG: CPBP family intramembrane glutamic endopeptidase [Gemmataceae bacterium]
MSNLVPDALPEGIPPGPVETAAAPADPAPVQATRRFPLHPNFWWALLWCVGALLFTQVPGAVVTIGVLLGAVFLQFIALDDLGSTETLFSHPVGLVAVGAGVVAAHLLLIGMALLCLRLIAGRDWHRQVALRWPAFSHVLLVLLMVPAFMVLAHGGYYLFRHVLHLPSMLDMLGGGMEQVERSFGGMPLLAGALLIGVMPGLSEELWCRAFLGRGIVGRHGYLLGVLGTSFLFGLIHVDPCQGGMAMLVGMILHFIYLTSRSLLIPMVLHFLNNSLAVASTSLPQRAILLPEGEPAPWFLYLAAGLALLAIGWTLYQSRARLATLPGAEPWQPPFPGVTCPPSDSATVVATPFPSLVNIGLVSTALAFFVVAVWLILQAGG